MIKKNLVALFVLMLVMGSFAYSQNLGQMGYIIKKAIPDTESIAVIFEQSKQDQILKQAQTAALIAKAKFNVYAVKSKSDLPKILDNFSEGKKMAVVIITDSGMFNQEGVKFVAQRMAVKNIPVVTNRADDTSQGAIVCIFTKNEKLETHVNKNAAGGLKITFPDDFLSTAIIDSK